MSSEHSTVSLASPRWDAYHKLIDGEKIELTWFFFGASMVLLICCSGIDRFKKKEQVEHSSINESKATKKRLHPGHPR